MKKAEIKITLSAIIFVVILLAVVMSGYLTIINTDTKTQLQSEYNTVYASILDVSSFKSNPDITYSTPDESKFFTDNSINMISTGGCAVGQSCSPRGSSININLNEKQWVFLLQDAPYLGGQQVGISIIKITPRTLESGVYDVEIDGIQKGAIGNTFSLNGDSTHNSGTILYIGSSALFKCDLRPDEVWIQESFAQAFSIKDLSFPPTKFCKETRPFVLRDIQQGETPIIPDPIPSFNRGDQLLPPLGNIITVNYATPNVPGITQPCSLDGANIKIAGKWVCSQVIKTTVLTRTIERRQIIPTGINSFTFTTSQLKNSFDLGSNTFSASQNFKCQFPDIDYLTPPNPSSDCYTSNVKYGNTNFEIMDGKSINLNDNIQVQYFANGQLNRKDNSWQNNLQGTYIFNIDKGISIDLQGGTAFKQNDKAYIPISITNYLPSNTIKLKVSQKIIATNQNLPDKDYTASIQNGDNKFSFPIDTSNLGLNQVTVQAYYPANAGTVLFPSEILKINADIQGGANHIPIKFVDKIQPEINKPGIIDQILDSIIAFFESIPSYFKSLF